MGDERRALTNERLIERGPDMSDDGSTYGGRDSCSQVGDRFETFEEMCRHGAAIRQGTTVVRTSRVCSQLKQRPALRQRIVPPGLRSVENLMLEWRA
jgi:hypothetical protein